MNTNTRDASTLDTAIVEMYKASESKMYPLKCSGCGEGLQNEKHSFLYNPSSQMVYYLAKCSTCGTTTEKPLADIERIIKESYCGTEARAREAS